MQVIVLGEKHSTRLVKLSNDNLRAIIADRLQQGYYDDDELYTNNQTFEERAKELTQNSEFINIPAEKAQMFLLAFLTSRSDYEYEDFDTETIEEIYEEA